MKREKKSWNKIADVNKTIETQNTHWTNKSFDGEKKGKHDTKLSKVKFIKTLKHIFNTQSRKKYQTLTIVIILILTLNHALNAVFFFHFGSHTFKKKVRKSRSTVLSSLPKIAKQSERNPSMP